MSGDSNHKCYLQKELGLNVLEWQTLLTLYWSITFYQELHKNLFNQMPNVLLRILQTYMTILKACVIKYSPEVHMQYDVLGEVKYAFVVQTKSRQRLDI